MSESIEAEKPAKPTRKSSMFVAFLKSAKLWKVLKAAKFLKIFFSVFSMALFAACYTPALGWAMSLGFVLLLFVHEMGHAIALAQKGFGLKLPIFIPGLGAAIFCPPIRDRDIEAYIGIGGPLLGTLAALACIVPGLFVGQRFWLTLALLGFALNAFNMVPISPMDGGRVTQAVSRHFRWLGLSGLLVMTLFFREPGMLLIWIIVLYEFPLIPRHPKWVLAIGMMLVQWTLTFQGVGRNHMTNWVDCGLSFVMVALTILRAFVDEKFDFKDDDRVELSGTQKAGWFVAWSCLLIIQTAMFLNLAKFLKP